MKPLSFEQSRAILKMAREICSSENAETLALSLQQYFEVDGKEPVADFFKRLKKFSNDDRSALAKSFSFGQIDSKLWLLRELRGFQLPGDATAIVLGGWHGVLALLMHWISVETRFRIRSIDIDDEATRRAAFLVKWYELHRDGAFFAASGDMYELNYGVLEFLPHGHGSPIKEVPDLLINTSCEHLSEFDRWWSRVPKGMRVALQSNDFFACAEHVGCVGSLDEFAERTRLSSVHFAGQLPFESYNRFMLIGIK